MARDFLNRRECILVNKLKIFACNGAEEFAEKVCREVGVELRKKRII